MWPVQVALECFHVPAYCPSLNHDLHFVLCDFGRNGQAFVETDPAHSDRDAVINDLLAGEYDRPLNVIAVNLAEGRACDVSETIAKALVKSGDLLTDGVSAFVATHLVHAAKPQ